MRWRDRWKYVLFSSIICFVLLIVIETALTIYYYVTSGFVGFPLNRISTITGKVNKEYQAKLYSLPWDHIKQKMRPGDYITPAGIHYRVNSLGFRGKDFDPFHKTKYRVICFGGSSTLGLESSEDQTYPAVLERLLNENGIDAEVLNCGFGFKSLNYIEWLLFSEGIDYRPDLITINSNRNTAIYDAARFENYEVVNSKLSAALIRYHFILVDNCMTYRTLCSIARRIGTISGTKGEIFSRYGYELQENFFKSTYPMKLERIIEAGKKHGFRVCLVKEPLYIFPEVQRQLLSYSIDQLWDLLKDKGMDVYESRIMDRVGSKFYLISNAILNKHMDILKEKHREIIVVDSMDDFIGEHARSGELFADYVHLTPKGNELLARRMFGDIYPVASRKENTKSGMGTPSTR